jgi:hypothetical protein
MTAGRIGYFESDKVVRAVMDADGFAYFDENGNTRAQMGSAELVTTAPGAETHYPAAVVLYKPDGKVLWQAPR